MGGALQADGAGGQLPGRCGPGPQAQLQLGEWRVGPGGGAGTGSRAVGTVLPAGRSLDGVLTLPQGHRHRAAMGELLHDLIWAPGS